MKTLKLLVLVACILSAVALSAQNTSTVIPKSPISDFNEAQLNNTATVPGFETQEEKLKITGTIYKSDGVTPAKDVILYIDQADAFGDYIYNKDNSIENKACLKTDADGKYTIYTYVPGSAYIPLTYPKRLDMKRINTVVKAPNQMAYDYDPFLFENDPFITKRCLKKLEKNPNNGILKLEKEGDLFVANRDIVLDANYAMK